MSSANEAKVPDQELERPLERRSLPPLLRLPDREWIQAVIWEVRYEKSIFNGKIQYLTKQVDGQEVQILDEDGKPIEQRCFQVVYHLIDHLLPNGQPRSAWLRLGVSFGKKAALPKYLTTLGYVLNEENMPTAKQIINFLTKLHVLIQYSDVADEETGELKQKLVKDAVKRNPRPPESKAKEQKKPPFEVSIASAEPTPQDRESLG